MGRMGGKGRIGWGFVSLGTGGAGARWASEGV